MAELIASDLLCASSSTSSLVRCIIDIPSSPTLGTVFVDDDGDFELPRPASLTVLVETRCQTSLEDVGLQLWRASELLLDFILDSIMKKLHPWEDMSVLELGCGTGLVSLVLSHFVKSMCATDRLVSHRRNVTSQERHHYHPCRSDVIDLTRSNAIHNTVFGALARGPGKLQVVELDWLKATENLPKELTSVDCVIAADVIYDDALTHSFMRTLK
jgi:hypothetical protein